MKHTYLEASVLFVFTMAASGCSIGSFHPPDSTLERNFFLNESDFVALLTEVNLDDRFGMIRLDMVRYGGSTFYHSTDFSGLEAHGLSRRKQGVYNQTLLKLGLVQITKDAGLVEFRVDDASLRRNRDSYKAYLYSLKPPEYLLLLAFG